MNPNSTVSESNLSPQERKRVLRILESNWQAVAHRLWVTNCCFANDSSGFPVLLPFFDAPSGGSFHPSPCYPGPPARTWRCPFHRRGVASPQAPDPDLESRPEMISQSTPVGPNPRWIERDRSSRTLIEFGRGPLLLFLKFHPNMGHPLLPIKLVSTYR
jgi:hypothetical protein